MDQLDDAQRKQDVDEEKKEEVKDDGEIVTGGKVANADDDAYADAPKDNETAK